MGWHEDRKDAWEPVGSQLALSFLQSSVPPPSLPGTSVSCLHSLSGYHHLPSLTGFSTFRTCPTTYVQPSVRAIFLHIWSCSPHAQNPKSFPLIVHKVKSKFHRVTQKSGTVWPLLSFTLIPSCPLTEPLAPLLCSTISTTPQTHQLPPHLFCLYMHSL